LYLWNSQNDSEVLLEKWISKAMQENCIK
jgi:hypothetical protein